MRGMMAAMWCLLLLGIAWANPLGPCRDVPPEALLKPVVQAVDAYGRRQRPTALMVVHDDRVVARWGDVSSRANVRSVRKSLLSALIGIAVSEGRLTLDHTIAGLGIDDRPGPLMAAEKRATVADLLAARSEFFLQADTPPAEAAHREAAEFLARRLSGAP